MTFLRASFLLSSPWRRCRSCRCCAHDRAFGEDRPPHDRDTSQRQGFTANEAVDVYFDTTDEFLATPTALALSRNHELDIPKSALPGSHWITAVGRKKGDSAQQLFTVRTDWPTYGFDAENRGRNPYENVIDKSNVGTLAHGMVLSPPVVEIWSSPAYDAGDDLFRVVGSQTIRPDVGRGRPVDRNNR